MRDTILIKYHDLREDLYKNYDKIKLVDDYDYNTRIPYTIFYLNKKENFDDFKELWYENREQCKELDDYDYDDIIDIFKEKALETFDFVEIGTLDIYTDKDYRLEI